MLSAAAPVLLLRARPHIRARTHKHASGSKAHLPGGRIADCDDILLENEDVLARSHRHSLFQERQVLVEHVVLLEQLVQRHRNVAEAQRAKEAKCDGKRWRITQIRLRGTPARTTEMWLRRMHGVA